MFYGCFKMLELISVHTPKCAGTSFRHSLANAYSEEKVFFDYADRVGDPASPINLDPEGFMAGMRCSDRLEGISAIHGHFNINKYSYMESKCARITFLRHPLERLVSHYFFWMSTNRHGHSLHNYVIDNNLSILQFSRLPYIRYFYTNVMFRNVDMAVFDFIGRYEDHDHEMDRLGRLLGKTLDVKKMNTNKYEDYDGKRTHILTNQDIRCRLIDTLSDEIRFYDKIFDA